MKKLYEIIQDDILKQINDGVLKPGSKIPTEKELMQKYNVSRITVIKALSELKENEIIQSNTKNGTIVSDKSTKNYYYLIPFVGILPKLNNKSTNMLYGIQDVANNNKCIAPFYNTMNSTAVEREVLKKLLNVNINALLIMPCSEMDNLDLFSAFATQNIPLIFVDRKPKGFDSPLITTNNFKAMYDFVTTLINMGYKRFATTITGEECTPKINRFEGFVSALLNNNITINNKFLLGDVEYINKYIKKTAFQRLKFFSDYNDILVEKYYSLEEKPDVICCASDNDALNLTDAFMRRDKKLPDDLIITGFDNMNYKLLENCNTVEQNFYEIGKVAIETALKLLNGEKVEKLTEIDAKIIIKNKK